MTQLELEYNTQVPDRIPIQTLTFTSPESTDEQQELFLIEAAPFKSLRMLFNALSAADVEVIIYGGPTEEDTWTDDGAYSSTVFGTGPSPLYIDWSTQGRYTGVKFISSQPGVHSALRVTVTASFY